jgi:hypothetical protein
MNHPHPIQVTAEDRLKLEGVNEKFITQGILRAREKTIRVLNEARTQLKEGMTEEEGRKMTMDLFADYGVTKHWHRVYVRFGAGTMLTFNDPVQPDYRLKENDPYYFDLGPVWKDEELGLEYEGDYGDTFVFGKNAEGERCANAARTLFNEAKLEWSKNQASGQAIYEFLKKRSAEMEYRLLDGVEGHRVADFPHHKYSKERLSKVPFQPKGSLWVLEVMLIHPSLPMGAFFEDLL